MLLERCDPLVNAHGDGGKTSESRENQREWLHVRVGECFHHVTLTREEGSSTSTSVFAWSWLKGPIKLRVFRRKGG